MTIGDGVHGVDGSSCTLSKSSSIINVRDRSKPVQKLSLIRKLAYGTGHVFNDMCASMWFTYLILFFHMVLRLNNAYAGLLLLIGQVADASATPTVGYLCDKTRCRYGRRKIWHLAGTVMVACSFFFFWHGCLGCRGVQIGYTVLYFSCFIILFQFGWAAVQISHLSLIPELTRDENERVGLNAIRYAFTILASLGVFVAVLLLLAKFSDNGRIEPDDEWLFSGMALGIVIVGLVFSMLFHLGTREPTTQAQNLLDSSEGRTVRWYKWFFKPNFYIVALIYMCTRLVVNLTQVYVPLYMLDTLALHKTSVAIAPLVIFMAGFVMTLLLKTINKTIGRYFTYTLGLLAVWVSLVCIFIYPEHIEFGPEWQNYMIYGAMILLGAGASTLLVTSLSMVADLIGCSVGSSAFVYGVMSFADKLSNGVAIQIIQALHPCKAQTCCPKCAGYYRYILAFVPGGAAVTAFVFLLFLLLVKLLKAKADRSRRSCPSRKWVHRSVQATDSASTTISHTSGEKTPLI